MLSLLSRRLYKYALKLKFAMPEHRVATPQRCKMTTRIASGRMWKPSNMSWCRPNVVVVFILGELLLLNPHPHLWLSVFVQAIFAIFSDGHIFAAHMRARFACVGQFLKVKICKWEALKLNEAALSAKNREPL